MEEVYALTTLLPNNRQNDLIVNKNALPMIIEWPVPDYYTHNGDFLPSPGTWNTNIDPAPAFVEEFNFSTKSPVKAFKKSSSPWEATYINYPTGYVEETKTNNGLVA